MRPQRPIREQAKESLKALLKKAKTKVDFQHIQCIWLRAVFGMSSDQVSLAIGLKPATVKNCGLNIFLEAKWS